MIQNEGVRNVFTAGFSEPTMQEYQDACNMQQPTFRELAYLGRLRTFARGHTNILSGVEIVMNAVASRLAGYVRCDSAIYVIRGWRENFLGFGRHGDSEAVPLEDRFVAVGTTGSHTLQHQPHPTPRPTPTTPFPYSPTRRTHIFHGGRQ